MCVRYRVYICLLYLSMGRSEDNFQESVIFSAMCILEMSPGLAPSTLTLEPCHLPWPTIFIVLTCFCVGKDWREERWRWGGVCAEDAVGPGKGWIST